MILIVTVLPIIISIIIMIAYNNINHNYDDNSNISSNSNNGKLNSNKKGVRRIYDWNVLLFYYCYYHNHSQLFSNI